VPDERHLYVTNWFSDNLSPNFKLSLASDEYFRMLQVYAENMAAHRQNVFWIPWNLVKVTREADGALSFDYAVFDRFVEIFLEAGVDGRIEIQPMAQHGPGEWYSESVLIRDIRAADRATGEAVSLGPDEGMGPFLEDLERHLEARGWLDRTMIHITDEPQLMNNVSYKEVAGFVHRHAPGIKRIEAIEASDFYGALDVWVPKLSHLRNWYDRYDEARRQGNELWYYICCHPTGRYLNRFLDYALLKVRLLHWLNYRYDLTGYLHWGFNFWKGDPFGPPDQGLPPGDRNIVYPGPKEDPYTLLDSIRWEVQRDSIEDYEYLWLLEDRYGQVIAQLGDAARDLKPAARSHEYAGRLIHDFTDYERDPAQFREVRRELAREIETVLDEPLVVWQTAPPEDIRVEPGPTAIEVRGATRPGARVTINDEDVTVSDDGRFLFYHVFWEPTLTLRLRVETDDGVKEQVRTYGARP